YEALMAARAMQAEVVQLISTLERFNGIPFVTVAPAEVVTGDGVKFVVSSESTPDTSGGSSGLFSPRRVYITLPSAQINMLNQSYAALQDSIYGGLVMQTRLSGYMDALSLNMDATGLHFDFTGLTAMLDARLLADPANALTDLIELNRYAGTMLIPLGWDGVDLLRTWVEQSQGDLALQSVMAELDVLTVTGDLNRAHIPDNMIVFGEGDNNHMTAGSGNDIMSGGAGNDTLYGITGDDVLEGGIGNDYLNGGNGNDTYLFSRGDGQDTIWNYDTGLTRKDVIQFEAGIAVTDVVVSRHLSHLILTIAGTTDSITVQNYFVNDAQGNYRVDEIRFVDGTVWDIDTVKALALLGRDEAQTLTGYASDDI
ncbi:MAG TPA: calcium-binding protein, partial [Gammaproteobacteria bacterium]|nr:calcium-binding protein [Gammaproteobacteria bacterium]